MLIEAIGISLVLVLIIGLIIIAVVAISLFLEEHLGDGAVIGFFFLAFMALLVPVVYTGLKGGENETNLCGSTNQETIY